MGETLRPPRRRNDGVRAYPFFVECARDLRLRRLVRGYLPAGPAIRWCRLHGQRESRHVCFCQPESSVASARRARVARSRMRRRSEGRATASAWKHAPATNARRSRTRSRTALLLSQKARVRTCPTLTRSPPALPPRSRRQPRIGPALMLCQGLRARAPMPTSLPVRDELEERARDRCGHLLRQVKQGHRRSIGRYRVLMQAATIRRVRRRRWLLLSDRTGHAARSHTGRAPSRRGSSRRSPIAWARETACRTCALPM